MANMLPLDTPLLSKLVFIRFFELTLEKARHESKTSGLPNAIKVESNPSYCQQLHLYCSTTKMTSVSETTRTLRYKLWSREIYTKDPITSPEILLEHHQMQDESTKTIQETLNSQFRLVL